MKLNFQFAVSVLFQQTHVLIDNQPIAVARRRFWAPAGVNGMRSVRAAGGITMAQDRISASDFEMPSAAIDYGKAEIVAPPWRMAQMPQFVADEWCADLSPLEPDPSAADVCAPQAEARSVV